MDAETGYRTKVSLILWANEHAEVKMNGCGRNREIVGRDELALAAEHGEQRSPPFSDLGAKLDDWDQREEGIQLRAAGRRARKRVGQVDADQEFRVDDRRNDDGLAAER